MGAGNSVANHVADKLGVYPVVWSGDQVALWASEVHGKCVALARNWLDDTVEAVGVAAASDRWRLEAIMDDARQVESVLEDRGDPVALWLLVARRDANAPTEVTPADLAAYLRRQGFEVDTPPRGASVEVIHHWVRQRFALPRRDSATS